MGFTICLKRRSLGISEQRAAWLISWLSRTGCENALSVPDLRTVLGRRLLL